MRYAQIRKMDISNGEGIGIALFTQGCPFHCKNCFNPETWNYDGGYEWTQDNEDTIIKLLEPNYITRLSVLGGEPLIGLNKEPLLALLKRAKGIYPNKRIWLYTGNLYEEICHIYANLLQYVDVLVDGQYVDKLKDFHLKWCGSSNQRVIDVQKTLKENKIILWRTRDEF